LLMQRYLFETSAPRAAFGGFPRVAHANGVSNPFAMYRSALSADTYNKAGMISDPLNMFDVAPVADGAAAVILTRRDLLPPNFQHPLVRISGSSQVTDRLALHDRQDLLAFDAVRLSVERACRQAGIQPWDVDLFELYDAYSILAALSLEAAGFAERGRGWQLAQDEALGLTGKLPIATYGGLKARGNPGGATGLYQAVEATLQLRSQAGINQVMNARLAMIQCLGGPAATATTHILEAL
jgi:acetyl-CoA C-acetyltransferase